MADELRCSFCSKTREEVRSLISGPRCYICDECVDLCYDIIQEEAMLRAHLEGAPVQMEFGFTTEAERSHLSALHSITLSLSDWQFDQDVLALIPPQLARTQRAVPIARAGSTVIVAMTLPCRVSALEAVKQATGLDVDVVVVSDEDMDRALADHYS